MTARPESRDVHHVIRDISLVDRLRIMAVLVFLLALLVGCAATADPPPGPPIELGDGDSTLSLYISNQSSIDPDVRVTVLVDGIQVLSGVNPTGNGDCSNL